MSDLKRLVTFETFDPSDEETWPDQRKRQWQRQIHWEHLQRAILVTCDIWDTDYISDNWELEFMTIFVTWQLRVTLDSIRNSCDVWLWCGSGRWCCGVVVYKQLWCVVAGCCVVVLWCGSGKGCVVVVYNSEAMLTVLHLHLWWRYFVLWSYLHVLQCTYNVHSTS